MMNKWRYKKIGDVCVVERGGSPRPIDKYITDDEKGINWIKIGDTSDSMYITSTAQKIIPEGMKKSRYVKPGDFLLSNSMSFGRPYILKIDGCIHDGWLVLRDKDNLFDKRFLYYYLSSPSTYQRFKSLAVGGVVNNLNSDMVRGVEIPIPSAEEQKHIADVLDKVSELIDLRKKQLSRLDELVKARFMELFGNLVIGDKFNENKSKIGDIASVTKLAGFEFTKYIQYKEQGDIIMLRGLNCKKGHLILDDIKWIDKETSDLLPRSKLYFGDILMTYAGTIGDVAMVDADDKYHLAPNVAKITLHDKKECNPLFLIHLFMYSHDYIMTFASQVAQASINMEKIRSFEYFFPPVELQNEFATFVEQTDKLKFEVKESLEKLETLKKALMQKYFG